MRIFFGIDFPQSVKAQLKREADRCERFCEKASFTDGDNYHLTLRFIGEIDPAMLAVFETVLKETADRVAPFSIHLSELGHFSKRGGHILFRGLRRERGLGGLVRNLDRALKNQGFPVEKMPFKPHVTLARRVRWKEDFQKMAKAVKLNDLEVPVDQIVIMESVRVEGRLVYRPITHARLKG